MHIPQAAKTRASMHGKHKHKGTPQAHLGNCKPGTRATECVLVMQGDRLGTHAGLKPKAAHTTPKTLSAKSCPQRLVPPLV
jgi:hypothetical protein